MNLRRGIAGLMALLGAVLMGRATVADSLLSVVDTYPVDAIVGIWQMAGDGAIFSITPSQASMQQFDVHIIESPDLSILPGTRCGSVRTTAEAGLYDGSLLVDPRTSTGRITKADCRFTLKAPGRMAITHYRRTKQISLRRLLPYMFRISIVDKSNRPDGLDGAIRIYPPTPGTTHTVL